MMGCHHCIHCNTLQHTATHCNTLQHTATHCNTLQHTATRKDQAVKDQAFDDGLPPLNILQHTATHCNTLQHAKTRHSKIRHLIMGCHHCIHCKSTSHFPQKSPTYPQTRTEISATKSWNATTVYSAFSRIFWSSL